MIIGKTSTMRPDAGLVDTALKGDKAAYGELVCRYGQCVLATVWRVLGDYHAAQDVTQEVFLIAYQKLGSLRSGSTFGPWILRIARRHAYRSAKRQAKVVHLETADVEMPSSADQKLADDQEQLLAAVARLPEHELVAVNLRYFQEHSVQEVAQITGRSVGTVTKQLSRALRRLRESMSVNSR